MEAIDIPAEPLADWLRIIEAEYFAEYLPAGGAAVKFVIADDPAARELPAATKALAERHGLLVVSVGAGTTRLHMLHDLFFAVTRALPWDSLLQSYIEDLFSRNGYPWPRPETAMSMTDLAAEFGVAANLLSRSRDQWLSRDLWEDPRLAQDFRAAMLSLCLARLEPDDAATVSPVRQWLFGEKVGLSLLRQFDIASRIGRTNARSMLISLCHWLRKAGVRGLLLNLDLRPALRAGSGPERTVRYTPAAVMDLYEVLRELIDDIEHLPGLFVLAEADLSLVSGDRKRTLDTYKALEMRIWPDVRPGDRQNPMAPLVTVSA
jgi:hypothetical protein